MKQIGNIVTIGDDVNCKLKITVRRNSNESPTDAQRLIEYLKLSNSEINSKIETCLTNLDALSGNAFATAFAKIPGCYNAGLTVKRRADYINKIAEFTDTYSYMIESLILSCPSTSSEINAFFKELSTKSNFKKILLKSISWSSRDNYNALNRDLVLLYYKQTKSSIDIKVDNTFIWYEGLLSSREYTAAYQDNGTIKITWVISHITESFIPNVSEDINKEIDPFTTVNIDFLTSLKFVGVKGVFPMPAFMFNWICNEYNDRELNTAIDVSLFALSFVFTATEIANTNKAWKIIIGITELVHSSGKLYFILSPETVAKLNNTSGGSTFLTIWDATGKILDLKTISESLINSNFPLLFSLEKAWEQVTVENPNIEELIGKSEYDKIKNLIQTTK